MQVDETLNRPMVDQSVNEAQVVRAPAPWQLTGDGYVLLYQLPHHFAAAHSNGYPYRGGFGAVVLVNYHSSNVGPYRELLFIPGMIAYPGKTGYSIHRIYVTTLASVVNGQMNWGIPKERADFQAETLPDGAERIRVLKDNRPFFEVTLRAHGPAVPLTAAVLPPLVQQRDNRTFITRLQSTGVGRYARMSDVRADAAHFPDVSPFAPLIAMKIVNFRMLFPAAQIVEHSQANA